jgi:hypothetical protein
MTIDPLDRMQAGYAREAQRRAIEEGDLRSV